MSVTSSVMIAAVGFMFFLYVCARLAESEAAGHSLGRLLGEFSKRPLAERLFILGFVVMMVAHGGSKSTNSAPLGGGIVAAGGNAPGDFLEAGAGGFGMLSGLDPEPPRLTTNQCLAGFALVRVATNAAPWLSVPSNAATHEPWARYGVAEDTFWLPATNWGFVLGTNAADGAHVSSSGTLSFGAPKGSPRAAALPDGTGMSFLAPLHGSLGTVPPQGRFWHAPTPSNSLLCTWQDVYAGRGSNSLVSFQAELFWNGDFAYRYAIPSNSSLLTPNSSFTNFVVGAQHNGGGETWALDATNLLASGLELHWRAFGLLAPGIDDHDDDGLSTYGEVMTYGTDPLKADTDRDGLEDAAELAAGTDPLDPDTDGDGLADGIDPRPAVWDDPDGDAGGDGLGYLFEVTHGLDPAADNALDSDGDGWPDWKELMAGTATNDMSSVPVNTDGPQLTQVPVLFEATVTLNADLPCPAVLNVGGHTLVLHKAGSWTLTLKEGVAYGLTLTAPRPCAVSLSCSLSSAFAAFQDPGGVFTGGAPVPGGAPAACGMIAQPVVSVTPEPPGRVCFHADAPKTVAAQVTPAMAGSYQWCWYGGDISSVTGRSANISWDGGDSSVSLYFTAAGASQPRVAYREVTKCSRPAGEPDWCDGHGCEHWFCACDNAGASGGDWCGFHGRPVSECREDICPTHDCPYAECPEDWCHEHGCWYAECSALWCHMCGHILPACVCGPVDEGVGGGGGGGTNGTNRVYGRGEDVTAAVNNDDDDADFTLDDSDGEVAGDDDLIELWPVGPVLGQCCPCPEHRAASVMSASLVNGTGNLALYEDAAKTTGFGGTVREGQPVYAEGTGASPYPWADRLLWRWVDANNDVHYLTNRFTVLSVRLFGDIDLDGDVDEDDIALHPAPSEDYGWGLPVSSNVFRKVRLRTDVGANMAGIFTLSLSGDPGIHIWTTGSPASTNSPLLVCGQTVTNGVNGVSFLSGADSDLYVEAVSNGTAKLTYGFTGAGAADGLRCAAALGMTALSVEFIDATSPKSGNSVAPPSNLPPFLGHTPWPFDVTHSPNPDKHMVVFYKDVIDSSFNAQDFDVTLTANILPSGITADMLSEMWSKISGPASGSLNRADTFEVKYQNPKIGGVYWFDFDLGLSGCAKSEANVVLPLAGAEVDEIVKADIVRADAFASNVLAHYSWSQRQRPASGKRWFIDGGAGDYLGRPDNATAPTVWAYNQVDANGFAAVGTWKGKPVRVSKISNFMVAYGARKIGVSSAAAWVSQIIGTWNDSSASKSWDAGWSVGGGAAYDTTVAALVADIWDEDNDPNHKNMRLWPNASATDNYVVPNSFYDPDHQFTSPGFLYMTSP